MMKNKRRSNLSYLSTLLFVFSLTIGSMQTASADIMTMDADEDPATLEVNSGKEDAISVLATSHRVAEVRHAIAQCRQGKFAEAVPVLEKHALKNDIGATYVLAKLYQTGSGVEKSQETAARLLTANAKSGHVPSLIALGEIRENASSPEAINLYKAAAAKGNLQANLKLGNIYERGLLGARANPKLAFLNYEKAAEADLPLGYYHLARCYDEGLGTSPNALLATRTFLKSAKKGVPAAQVQMARRYFEGKGLEKDRVAAFGWLTVASQSGSVEAMVLLGRRYEAGDIVPQNLDLAGKLYSNAAKRGDPTGKYFLALLYAKGKGTKQDLVRAYTLLHDSAKYLPMAKEALEEIESNLSVPQKAEAKKKIAEAKKAG